MTNTEVPFFRRVLAWVLYLPTRFIKLVLYLVVDVGGRLYGWSNPRPAPYRPESPQDRINRLSR
ncbi:MAG: hypothetical protein K8L91_17700 [Anaerolineae bacterium]|nr:hypothetical protein [Anaerolineae bacterium]